MNNNELLKELYKVIKASGWLDKATTYMREHPERFNDCITSDGKIANITMSVSYQPKSLSAVANVNPLVFISMGNVTVDERELNICNGIASSRTYIDNELVVEVKEVV